MFILNICELFLFKTKKGIGITNTFQRLLGEYVIRPLDFAMYHKPNKIWVDKILTFTIDQLNYGYKTII